MKLSADDPGSGWLRVFVVDDNALILDALTQVLKSLEGISVVGQATDAETAIVQIHQVEPDVVILDLHMSGNGGLYVLRALRERRNGAVVMIFTAYNQQQYRLESMRLGADFFFGKTLDDEKMFAELTRLALRKVSADG